VRSSSRGKGQFKGRSNFSSEKAVLVGVQYIEIRDVTCGSVRKARSTSRTVVLEL
jgi:hypothetical protein